jgi:hypothetical protein
MPANKDFKRLVRGRMRKTGEAYTTARARLLQQKRTTPPPSRVPAPSEYARIAGRSDAILKERTGCTWERWVKALDRAKAYTWPHREIAQYVRDRYKTDGWWAQTVTVGYERIKGLRAVGQRRDGSFEANKSKTFAVPLERLYRAFGDKRTRERWLPGVDLKVRTATRGKSMRITWPDQTSLVVGFLRTGTGKSQVALQHGKLPDRDSAARMKQYWAERLRALEDVLATR